MRGPQGEDEALEFARICFPAAAQALRWIEGICMGWGGEMLLTFLYPPPLSSACASGTAMEDTLTCSHATFSQVFGRQGQLMHARTPVELRVADPVGRQSAPPDSLRQFRSSFQSAAHVPAVFPASLNPLPECLLTRQICLTVPSTAGLYLPLCLPQTPKLHSSALCRHMLSCFPITSVNLLQYTTE
ncbi:hypothetical protein NQZ68_010646 [Dissostichus eleginoides]|nr:hypothetical protein NQZ68_010646 [Dissostichus eleginoides]